MTERLELQDVNWPSVRRISGWKLVLVQMAGHWSIIVASEREHDDARGLLPPPPPASRLVDAARVFGPDERRAIEVEAAAVAEIVYVVTIEAGAAIGAVDYAAHLAKAWLPEGAMAPRGAVMVLEFSGGEHPVFGFSGTWTENAGAAKEAFDELAGTDASAGVRAALRVLGGHPPSGGKPNQEHAGSTAAGIAGAFFVLTTMLFVYQRVQERLESRARREMERAAGLRRGGG